ncbi:hypothetical protein V6N11_021031 [Hibiscus sabdariffa]|uniref:Uncharacterized protein n=1 Tax=Hibiscus sabdariffa TaxID=183260 RepID=A0ABR1ZET3_9ROSI
MIHSVQFTVADDAPSPAPIVNVVAVGEPVSTGGEPSSAPTPGPASETTTKFAVIDDAPSPAPIANVVAVGEPVSTGSEPSSALRPTLKTTTKV